MASEAQPPGRVRPEILERTPAGVRDLIDAPSTPPGWKVNCLLDPVAALRLPPADLPARFQRAAWETATFLSEGGGSLETSETSK